MPVTPKPPSNPTETETTRDQPLGELEPGSEAESIEPAVPLLPPIVEALAGVGLSVAQIEAQRQIFKHALAAREDLRDSIAKMTVARADWQKRLADIARPGLSVPEMQVTVIGPPPELVALRGVQDAIGEVAEILQVTGEQVQSMWELGGKAVEALAHLEAVSSQAVEESSQLRQVVKDGQDSQAKSDRTITRLTWAIVGLTVALLLIAGYQAFHAAGLL